MSSSGASSKNEKDNRNIQIIFALGYALLMSFYCLRLWHPSANAAFGDDPSVYMVSAKSLAAGKGYRLINFPEAPVANFYPIGYPAVLSVLVGSIPVTREEVLKALILSLTGFAFFSLLATRLLELYVSRKTALIVGLMVGLSPYVYDLCGCICSECLFAPVITLSLLVFVKALSGAQPKDWKPLDMAAVGLCAGASMLLRTVGFTVIAALGVVLILRLEWRKLLVYAIFAGLITVPWVAWSMTHKGGTYNGYAGEFLADFTWRTPINNAAALIRHIIPTILFPPFETQAAAHIPGAGVLAGAVGCLASVLIGVGWIALLKQRDAVAFVVTFYMSIVLLWPWDPSRFVVPILPLLAILLLEGGRTLSSSHSTLRLSWRKAGTAVLMLVIIGALSVDGMRLRNIIRLQHWGGAAAASDWQEKLTALAWIRSNTPDDALIISSYPYAAYLFTNRKCMAQETPERMRRILSGYERKVQPVYIFATERKHAMTGVEMGMTPVLEYARQHPGQLQLVWSNTSTTMRVYLVRKAAAMTGSDTQQRSADGF